MKNTKTSNTSTTRIIMLFAMLVLSGAGMFAQSAPAAVTVAVAAATDDATAVEANPNLNMVSWFMGTKQTPKSANSKEGVNKKQMINSGIAPNRLLIKAFLKKANDFQSAVA